MEMAIWPSLIEGKYLREVLKSIESILYLNTWKNGLLSRAHASEETLNSNIFLLVNVAPAMEGDQSSRDMTAFGYRQKNYAQGCRKNTLTLNYLFLKFGLDK